MAYIKVNHKKMLDAAYEIDEYILKLNKNMTIINSNITSLKSNWQGEDYNQVKVEWDEINASGATTDKMVKSLKSYAGSIREASKMYKEAQARAINRANILCK